MSKFCPNCGAMLDDSTVFCSSCGTQVESQPQPQPEYNQYNQYNDFGYQPGPSFTPPPSPAPKKKHFEIKLNLKIKKKPFIIGASVFVAVLAIILVYCLVFTPAAVARSYVNAMINGNGNQAANALPSFFFEDKDDKEDFIDDFEDYYEPDDDEKVSIKDVVTKKLSEDEQDALEDRLEYFEEYLDDFDADDINVKSAKKVYVFVVVTDEEGDTYSNVLSYYVVSYKGLWKVLDTNMLYR